jgi:glycosyltransferase involved in cell wall biosynthesis
VDDGSTDETASIVACYARTDSRIAYVRRENGGPVSAMNAGARVARSPMLAFLDSDDEFEPEHLRLRLDYLAQNPEVEMVWGGSRAVGPCDRQFYADIERPGKRLHASECHLCGTFVMRRLAFERAGGFRRLVSADYDLCKRIEAMGSRVDQVSFPTLVHHMEGDDRIGMWINNVGMDGELLPEPDNLALVTQGSLAGAGSPFKTPAEKTPADRSR